MNYSPILTKGYKSSLESTEIESGKVRITVDTAEMFIDSENERIQISDIVKGMDEAQIRSTMAPLPKLYLSTDTKRLLQFNSETGWEVVAEPNSSLVERALEADNATNASTAEYSKNSGTAQYASKSNSANSATNATNASTANYANNAGTANYSSKSDSSNTATSATNASTANYSKNAGTANYGTNAGTANFSKNSGTANYSDKAYKDANGKPINTTYAPLSSPIFTGTPTVPTPVSGDNSNTIANTAFVSAAILEALSDIIGYSTAMVDSVEELPTTGKAGTHYFVPSSESTEEDNVYDEYIWIDSLSGYEKIGSPVINMDGYFNEYEITGTGNAITGISVSGGKLTFTKGASFLTSHPSVSKSNSTISSNPSSGAAITVVKSITVDNNGHVTNFVLDTVTLPNSVSNASTANYATNAGTANYAKSAGSTTNATSATNASTANYSKNAGTASYGTNAGTANYSKSAGTATSAKNDGYGNVIVDTYIKSVVVSGKTVTVTKGNGSTVAYTTQDTDTKNTAGSTNSSSKLFLIGATAQAANPQTYSHDTAYVGTDGHLYSNNKQAVNLSDTQDLTNKTYNGYTLAEACSRGVDTTPTNGSTNLITSGAAYDLKKSVADGKALLATTISEYNYETASDATFEVLNQNMTLALDYQYDIGFDEGSHDASISAKEIMIGGYSNYDIVATTDWTWASFAGGLDDVYNTGYNEGWQDGYDELDQDIQLCNATAANVLAGKIFSTKGNMAIAGTMSDFSSNIQTVTAQAVDNAIIVDIPDGYHTKIEVECSEAYREAYQEGYTNASASAAEIINYERVVTLNTWGYNTDCFYPFEGVAPDGELLLDNYIFNIKISTEDGNYLTIFLDSNGETYSGEIELNTDGGSISMMFYLDEYSTAYGLYMEMTGVTTTDIKLEISLITWNGPRSEIDEDSYSL